MEKKENCLVFITHKLTDEMLEYLSYLKKETVEVMDLLVLYDNATQPICPENYPWLDFCLFDSRQLKGFFHRGEKLLPNPLLALMHCAVRYSYAHYLLMENDIVLEGNFNRFVSIIDRESNVDYIHIASDIEGGPRRHWPVNFIWDNPFGNLYFSWCQLFYISRRYLEALHNFTWYNDSFYYEFLLPTMAYNQHFIIRQFENYGYRFELSWGPAEVYEYKYAYEHIPNTFYHPIKNLKIVNDKLQIHNS